MCSGAQVSQTFSITLRPLDDSLPLLRIPGMRVQEGVRKTITEFELKATDADTEVREVGPLEDRHTYYTPVHTSYTLVHTYDTLVHTYYALVCLCNHVNHVCSVLTIKVQHITYPKPREVFFWLLYSIFNLCSYLS